MKNIKSVLKAVALLLVLSVTVSCESMFDGEGDCSPRWYVQFVYTKNPQALTSLTGVGADAFAQSVRGVTLYVYDSATGQYVAEFEASGEELGSGDWKLPIDLKPGKYDMVAWCHGNADKSKAFEYLTTRSEGVAREAHSWRVVRDADGLPWNLEAWNPVQAHFYGERYNVEITDEQGDHTVVVELTKNTNHINVTVQFTTDEFQPEDFYIQWKDMNGTLDAYNNIVDGDWLTYQPYKEKVLDEDELIYNDDIIEAGTKYSYFGVSRLMTSNRNNATLEVRRKDDDSLIYGVSLIGLICNLHDGDDASDQYYMDCQDTYSCHFILQPSGKLWTAQRLHINNWTLVPQQSEVIGL